MCVARHEADVEPVVTGTGPRDKVTAHLHNAVRAAVRQLVVIHVGMVLSALHPDPDVPGLFLGFQSV